MPALGAAMLMTLSVFGSIRGGNFQTVVLCGLATTAAVSGFFAAFKGPRQTFILNFIRGWLATLYAIGYLYLLIVRPDRGEWSEVMSGLGYVTWPVVWIYPSLYTYWHRKSVAHLPPSLPGFNRLTSRGRDVK